MLSLLRVLSVFGKKGKPITTFFFCLRMQVELEKQIEVLNGVLQSKEQLIKSLKKQVKAHTRQQEQQQQKHKEQRTASKEGNVLCDDCFGALQTTRANSSLCLFSPFLFFCLFSLSCLFFSLSCRFFVVGAVGDGHESDSFSNGNSSTSDTERHNQEFMKLVDLVEKTREEFAKLQEELEGKQSEVQVHNEEFIKLVQLIEKTKEGICTGLIWHTVTCCRTPHCRFVDRFFFSAPEYEILQRQIAEKTDDLNKLILLADDAQGVCILIHCSLC